MKSILYFLVIVAPLLFSCNSKPVQNNFSDYDKLKEGFSNPSGAYRPKEYWWWLNGNMDTTRMKEELSAMKKAHVSKA